MRREFCGGMPFVGEDRIAAAFTPADERTREHGRARAFPDDLVAEPRDADIRVTGAPMHNFGPPAVLKARIDRVAPAGLTFRHAEKGRGRQSSATIGRNNRLNRSPVPIVETIPE